MSTAECESCGPSGAAGGTGEAASAPVVEGAEDAFGEAVEAFHDVCSSPGCGKMAEVLSSLDAVVSLETFLQALVTRSPDDARSAPAISEQPASPPPALPELAVGEPLSVTLP